MMKFHEHIFQMGWFNHQPVDVSINSHKKKTQIYIYIYIYIFVDEIDVLYLTNLIFTGVITNPIYKDAHLCRLVT